LQRGRGERKGGGLRKYNRGGDLKASVELSQGNPLVPLINPGNDLKKVISLFIFAVLGNQTQGLMHATPSHAMQSFYHRAIADNSRNKLFFTFWGRSRETAETVVHGLRKPPEGAARMTLLLLVRSSCGPTSLLTMCVHFSDTIKLM
jgi:hypothetical protein